MTDINLKLFEAAERLPAAERIELIEQLLATLDQPDPEIDRAWAVEAADRLEAFRKGELSARDADEVLAKHIQP